MQKARIYESKSYRDGTLIHDMTDDTWWSCPCHPLGSRNGLLRAVAGIVTRDPGRCTDIYATTPPSALGRLLMTVEVKDE